MIHAQVRHPRKQVPNASDCPFNLRCFEPPRDGTWVSTRMPTPVNRQWLLRMTLESLNRKSWGVIRDVCYGLGTKASAEMISLVHWPLAWRTILHSPFLSKTRGHKANVFNIFQDPANLILKRALIHARLWSKYLMVTHFILTTTQ